MIYFLSRTGNIQHIVNKLINIKCVGLDSEMKVTSPYLLLTYTDKLGEIPEKVDDFLINNHSYCKGVIASGNSNFGINYFCGSANKINEKYNIPIIHKIELRGYDSDLDIVRQAYKSIIEGDNN